MTTPSTELLPCPFCGGAAGAPLKGNFVRCWAPRCGAQMIGRDRKHAVACWNKRNSSQRLTPSPREKEKE